MKKIDGGVCAAKGFNANGVHCGIRKNKTKRDLALIYSETRANAAAVYTTNLVKGAPLTVTKNNIADGYSFLESMISSLGVGLGFWLAMVLFAGVRSKMMEKAPPKAFRGLPVTLIAASIVAMSFYGFSGVVEGIVEKISSLF